MSATTTKPNATTKNRRNRSPKVLYRDVRAAASGLYAASPNPEAQEYDYQMLLGFRFADSAIADSPEHAAEQLVTSALGTKSKAIVRAKDIRVSALRQGREDAWTYVETTWDDTDDAFRPGHRPRFCIVPPQFSVESPRELKSFDPGRLNIGVSDGSLMLKAPTSGKVSISDRGSYLAICVDGKPCYSLKSRDLTGDRYSAARLLVDRGSQVKMGEDLVELKHKLTYGEYAFDNRGNPMPHVPRDVECDFRNHEELGRFAEASQLASNIVAAFASRDTGSPADVLPTSMLAVSSLQPIFDRGWRLPKSFRRDMAKALSDHSGDRSSETVFCLRAAHSGQLSLVMTRKSESLSGPDKEIVLVFRDENGQEHEQVAPICVDELTLHGMTGMEFQKGERLTDYVPRVDYIGEFDVYDPMIEMGCIEEIERAYLEQRLATPFGSQLCIPLSLLTEKSWRSLGDLVLCFDMESMVYYTGDDTWWTPPIRTEVDARSLRVSGVGYDSDVVVPAGGM